MAKTQPNQMPIGNPMIMGGQALSEQAKENYADTLDRFKNQNQMVSTLARIKELQRDEEDRMIDRAYKKAQTGKLEAETGEFTKPIADTREYKLRAATEKLKEPIELQKINAEKKKDEKKDKFTLIDKRDALDKEFRPFERLYGSIGNLEQKFQTGNLNPQDRLQLVRIIVPLSEINPGVVREAEQDMVLAQQGIFSKVKGYITGNVTGEKINDTVVKEMFDAARSLKPVVDNMKYDSVRNIESQAKDLGLDKYLPVILGDKNSKLLKRPNSFASFNNPTAVRQGTVATTPKPVQGYNNLTDAEKNMPIEELQRLVNELEDKKRKRSVVNK
jgi:hypothetical protein